MSRFRESESVGDWKSEWSKLWSVGLGNEVKEEDGGEDTMMRDGRHGRDEVKYEDQHGDGVRSNRKVNVVICMGNTITLMLRRCGGGGGRMNEAYDGDQVEGTGRR